MPRTHRSLYRFEIHHPETGLVADVSHLCTSRSFTLSLNREEKLDLAFNARLLEEHATAIGLTPDELLGAGLHDIHVWRGNKALFGARVRYTRASLTHDGETIELHATGYLDDLDDRYLWPVSGVDGGVTRYENTDIGELMWDMIDTTQNRDHGDLGFTQGTIQTSRNLTDTWEPYATSLKDIFIALTERINAVDFSFTYDRKLNVHYPRQGRVQSDLRFTYPGNIVSLTMPVDASQMANVAINRGSGNGLDITPIETITNDWSLSVYGRRERIDDYPDVSVTTTLENFGEETVRTFGRPLVIPDVTLRSGKEPPLGAYGIGDWVMFSIANRPTFAAIHGQRWRIVGIAVNLNDLDTEEVRLTVANQ